MNHDPKMCGKIPKVDHCEWELPQMCQEHHRHAHFFTGWSWVRWKENPNQDTWLLQFFYCMSKSNVSPFKFRYFDEWSHQLQALRVRSFDITNCSFSRWTSIRQAFVCSWSIVKFSEWCRTLSFWDSWFYLCSMFWTWPISICFLNVWGLFLGSIKQERTPKEGEKLLQHLLKHVCNLTKM